MIYCRGGRDGERGSEKQHNLVFGFCVLVRVLKCLTVMVFVITITFATA